MRLDFSQCKTAADVEAVIAKAKREIAVIKSAFADLADAQRPKNAKIGKYRRKIR